jgi:N-formylglutamate deformylase
MSLLLHLPHASTHIPLMEGYTVDGDTLQAELLKLTDHHTDDLFANDRDVAVVATFSRIFCDAERFTDDTLEVMAARGMGVLYTHTDAGERMRTVTPELRERILREHYAPHHARLTAAVQAALDSTGQATVVDGHSYPDVPLVRDLDQDPARPDFNIGTDPFHTPTELVDVAVAYFSTRGYTLGVDRPYRGTLVPMTWYQRDARVRSIMLEVNRALYLLPGSNTRSARYAEVKDVVQGFLDAMRGMN